MAETRNLRIALNEVGGAQWTGGITYRENLRQALQTCPDEAEVFMVATQQQAGAVDQDHQIMLRTAGGMRGRIDAAGKRFLGRDLAAQRALRGRDIDLLFPTSWSVGARTRSIYWMPDFQYKHLPHLYSPTEISGFDRKLPRYFANVPVVILSSEDARRDMERFWPEHVTKARVVRFVAHVPKHIYEADPATVAEIYHLPKEFIYLPNQFWAHKNHGALFEALAILKQRGIRPFVVCSGNPVDVRKPAYFAQLLQRLSELGVREQVALVGLLPHAHVYALIRQAKFLANPSLFEGWSTSVEEAKSVGKRVLLSDLAVHQEQNAPGATYFDRSSPNALADKMGALWQSTVAGPDHELESAARRLLPGRMRQFADAFLSACRDARGAGV